MPMLDGLTTSNGIGWSPDGRTMYLADSGPRVIHAFDFDGDAGTISGGRVLVTVPEDVGAPDGLTVDAAGDLWVAIWGGGRVHRYSPAGELREVLAVPAVADDELRVRRPRPASAVRHDRHRGLDGRRASGRPEGRARLPIRDRCDRTPGRPVPPGPSLVELSGRSLKTDDFGRLARSERRTNREATRWILPRARSTRSSAARTPWPRHGPRHATSSSRRRPTGSRPCDPTGGHTPRRSPRSGWTVRSTSRPGASEVKAKNLAAIER